MKALFKLSLPLLLSLFVVSVVSADDAKKVKSKDQKVAKEKKDENKGEDATKEDFTKDLPQFAKTQYKRLSNLGLDGPQKLAVFGILKDNAPKIEEAQKERRQKVNAVLTKEQRKARNAARKKAAGEGKKGKALAKAVADAVELTEDQKKELATAGEAFEAALKDYNAAIDGVLTKPQIEKLRGKKKSDKGDAGADSPPKPKAVTAEVKKDAP